MQCVTSSLPLAPPESRLECCYMHALCCCILFEIGAAEHKNTQNYRKSYLSIDRKRVLVHTHHCTRTNARGAQASKHAQAERQTNTERQHTERVRMQHLYIRTFTFMFIVCVDSSLSLSRNLNAVNQKIS